MTIDPGLAIVLASVIAIGGYWVQSYLARKREMQRQISREKEERFRTIIEELPYVFFKEYKERVPKDELIAHAEKFFSAYRELWLYASDDVIKGFNTLIDIYMKPVQVRTEVEQKAEQKLVSVLLEMRKDLDINTSLKESDFRFFVVS